MTQPRSSKAVQNIGLSAPDSVRALNVVGISFGDFVHHAGMRPKRIGTSSHSVLSHPSRGIFVDAAEVLRLRLRLSATIRRG